MKREKYRVRAPAVVSETIDGEVVIMNLKSGNYYSLQSTGADIWDWIERGLAHGDLLHALDSKYDGPRADMESALDDFLQHLKDELLIEDLAGSEGNGAASTIANGFDHEEGPKTPFKRPELNVYSDMQDLLLLDPIHDVDETGWPTPKDS